jgi:protocatechuate 3,4-dioxygenase alpha subunit
LFTGFGRTPTDEEGIFRFKTIKPGRVTDLDGALQAPHINVTILMRGLLRHLVTRIYFSGDRGNDNDPVLALVPKERRHTLLARSTSGGSSLLEWNVVLQGEQETVFFDW